MLCKNCNIEVSDEKCPVCGEQTDEIPCEIFWCNNCKTPIIKRENDLEKDKCPICGMKSEYMCVDLRPVFPEERLLVEIIKKEPFKYAKSSVWAANNRYYIDGKPLLMSIKELQKASPELISSELKKHSDRNHYNCFNIDIQTFIKANKSRLNYITDEAYSFIQRVANDYKQEQIVISFSGGKDSTVTADLAVKALSNPSLVHVFGDTTLEFPLTIEYAERFKKNNPLAIFKIAKNKEQVFEDVCIDIGPPARMMRWCCSMFKTGPITRVLNSLFRNDKVLTFYGIRKCESVSRSKYHRIEASSESMKIRKQTVASPIFYWKDIDIWLYILSKKIDFNEAYKLGYDRVGCWCCPNNNVRAQVLSQIYMPEKSKKWREMLIDFAKKVGKPDPEIYVDSGKWKARQGGNGLKSALDVKIKFTNCTSEEYAKIYQLNKPINDSFIGLFTPFGRIAPELGRKLIKETIIVDCNSNVPILSIQPFSQDNYDYAVKIKTLNVAKHDELQRMVGYQIRKFNACRKCLKCESVCRYGAISIIGDDYYINPEKCRHCKMCVTAKYIDGGCMMDKYLRTKD